MNVGIINIGDELLTGKKDPYPAEMIEAVRSKGADVAFIQVITDDIDVIVKALAYSQNADVDILIVTGGLGPTLDDLTREAVAEYMGTELEIDEKSLDELEDGDTIAVPNDTTNEARALLLLQDNGIIKLKDGAGLEATVNDIAENPKNIKIQELEAAQVARVTGEVAYVVLNGNYALAAGFSVGKDALAYEQNDSEAAKTYVNVIAVKEGNENNEEIKALVDVLKSDDVKNYIKETYDGAVLPYEE